MEPEHQDTPFDDRPLRWSLQRNAEGARYWEATVFGFRVMVGSSPTGNPPDRPGGLATNSATAWWRLWTPGFLGPWTRCASASLHTVMRDLPEVVRAMRLYNVPAACALPSSGPDDPNTWTTSWSPNDPHEARPPQVA